MARFVPGQPVVTAEPTVVVDAGLPVGQHRFQLEVLTGSGQRSPPVEAVVQVQASTVTVGIVQPPLTPTVPSDLTPALAPRPIVTPMAMPSIVSTASTLPKTMPPSTTSRSAVPGLPRKKAVSPSKIRRKTRKKRG